MKAPLIAATMIVAPLISQCWIVAQELKFIEEHNLQRVRVTCYLPTGNNCADGTPPYLGTISTNKEHLGQHCILYRADNLEPIGEYVSHDIGGHKDLQNGSAIDIYQDTMQGAWGWLDRNGTTVYVEWIEREEDDNVDQYQTDGHATQTPADD